MNMNFSLFWKKNQKEKAQDKIVENTALDTLSEKEGRLPKREEFKTALEMDINTDKPMDASVVIELMSELDLSLENLDFLADVLMPTLWKARQKEAELSIQHMRTFTNSIVNTSENILNREAHWKAPIAKKWDSIKTLEQLEEEKKIAKKNTRNISSIISYIGSKMTTKKVMNELQQAFNKNETNVA